MPRYLLGFVSHRVVLEVVIYVTWMIASRLFRMVSTGGLERKMDLTKGFEALPLNVEE